MLIDVIDIAIALSINKVFSHIVMSIGVAMLIDMILIGMLLTF